MVLLKWAGSKNSSCSFIADKIGRIEGNYYEPCFGSGAVGWELKKRNSIRGKMFISDTDADLIGLWKTIRDNPEELVKTIRQKIDSGLFSKSEYYRVRNIFNGNGEDISSIDARNPVDRSAIILYLNRQGYNGLWRRNSEGKYNVPIGENAGINFDFLKDEILRHAEWIKGSSIEVADFEDVMRRSKQGDVVYLDPPYYSETGKNFTQYDGKIFTKENMDTLYASAASCGMRGVRIYISCPGYFSLSNVQNKRVRNIYEINVKRAINSDGANRGAVKEKLVEVSISD